jgi:6-phosphogluconolactonase
VTPPAPLQIIVEAAPRFAGAAAEWIAAVVEADIREHGRCAMALSGGATPRLIYERLARDPLALRISWRDVEIFFGDERAVPPGDPASNYGMAAASLLGRVPIPPVRVHRMEAERADRDEAARDYERILPERFDLLLLGMGADGHTASLFPGSVTLDERTRRVMPVTGPSPPAERLTITPPVIAAARRVAVLVAGADKAATAARALQGPVRPRELPVQLALGGTWFLDRDAAAGLKSAAA